ncbi:hypothetical protein HK104_005286, partial [Borealophlyctis nickersoniae]
CEELQELIKGFPGLRELALSGILVDRSRGPKTRSTNPRTTSTLTPASVLSSIPTYCPNLRKLVLHRFSTASPSSSDVAKSLAKIISHVEEFEMWYCRFGRDELRWMFERGGRLESVVVCDLKVCGAGWSDGGDGEGDEDGDREDGEEGEEEDDRIGGVGSE